MDEIRSGSCEEIMECFNCGSSRLKKEWRRQTFQYGNDESAVELCAEMLVYTCEECDLQFAGAEAEDARQEAICRHLGVLTPAEIVAIRNRTGMTRNQFAECTRIGIASLKRWESGVIVQNAANDGLIYLMKFSENVDRLRARDCSRPLQIPPPSGVPELQAQHRSVHRFRGRSIPSDRNLMERAEQWALRA
ncbi:MAG: hypothetical protein ACLQG3_08225 [Terracidiphilus sp.]